MIRMDKLLNRKYISIPYLCSEWKAREKGKKKFDCGVVSKKTARSYLPP